MCPKIYYNIFPIERPTPFIAYNWLALQFTIYVKVIMINRMKSLYNCITFWKLKLLNFEISKIEFILIRLLGSIILNVWLFNEFSPLSKDINYKYKDCSQSIRSKPARRPPHGLGDLISVRRIFYKDIKLLRLLRLVLYG